MIGASGPRGYEPGARGAVAFVVGSIAEIALLPGAVNRRNGHASVHLLPAPNGVAISGRF